MIEAYKRFWGHFPIFDTTVSKGDFFKGIFLHIFICIALYLMPSKIPLIVYAIISCESFLGFCGARLRDSGHDSYWLFLLLTGAPGLFYVLYLLFILPTLSLDNGNKYKELEIILKETDTKNLILFEFLSKMRYNNHNYVFLCETNEKLSEVTILQIDEDGETFTSVDDSTSEELFKIFKQNTKYEFVQGGKQ